mgnify:CR=1 FL=1
MSALFPAMESIGELRRQIQDAEARAVAWELIARAGELQKMGLWDAFASENEEVLGKLRKKVEGI